MYRWADVALLLVAWAWIIAHAPHDSLWYDETVNAYLATSSWATIWEWSTQIDNQLPLHFFVLKLWTIPFGSSEFALRLFSYWVGLLTAAGLMKLGRQLTQRTSAGWLAVLFCLPLGGFLYASSEVRTYGLAMALLVWSSVWMLRLWRDSRPIASSNAALYSVLLLLLAATHYTAWPVVLVQGLYVAWKLMQRRGVGLQFAIISGLPTFVAVLTWLVLLGGRDINAGTAFEGEVSLRSAFNTYISFALHGQKIFTPIAIERGIILFVVALLGGGIWLLRQPRSETVLVLLLAVLPLAIMIVLTNQIAAKLSGRHLWVLWVALPLLWTGCITQLPRTIPPNPVFWKFITTFAIGGLLVWGQNLSLTDEYRGDLRGAFAIIQREAGPNDLLVLRDGTLFTAAEYYNSPIPYVGIPANPLTDVSHQVQIFEALDTLKAADFTSKTRVWVLSWQADTMDPMALGWGILDYYSQGDRQWWLWPQTREVSLASYTLHPPQTDLLDHIAALPGVLQVPPDGPSLLGYGVYYPSPQTGHCSAIVQTWWWRGTTDYPTTLVSVRLADGEGERIVQADIPPAGFFYPQTSWPPFVPILGRTELSTPCEVWQKAASLHLVVYDSAGQKPTQPVLLDTLR